MSYFDQEQPFDYTNKYNENIGTISPKSHHKDSTTTRPSSTFGQYTNHPTAMFSGDYSSYSNQLPSHYHQHKSHDSLDSDDFTHLCEADTTGSCIIYQTENTPICFSNDSPLSSLSLECLPSLNSASYHLNSNNNIMKSSLQEPNLNSSGDSLVDYNMEGTPDLFASYDSPLSPLSLNFSDGEHSPPTLDFLNRATNRNNEDIVSMMSSMSVDNGPLTRSSNDKLNQNFKFGQLSRDEENSDAFSLINFNQSTQRHQQPTKVFQQQQSTFSVNQEIRPLATGRYEDDDHQQIKKEVDFENGFDDDNDDFYLDKCISAGRRSNREQQFNQQQNSNSTISQYNHQFNDSHNTIKVKQENISPDHLITFDKQEILKQPAYNQLTLSHQQQQSYQSQQFKQQQSQQFARQIPQMASISKPSKHVVKLDETGTTITDCSTFSSRSMYKIDGEEERRESSVVFAPVSTLSTQYYAQREEKYKIQFERSQDHHRESHSYSFKEKYQTNHSSPVKEKGIKNKIKKLWDKL